MTAMDFESLTRPLPGWHPKAWYFGLARALLGSRLRPVALTRHWLEAAGFVVEEVPMEPLGIFGVARARKA